MDNQIIGRCVGETTLVSVSFISKELPQMGEYVTLKYDGKIVLGMVEGLHRGSVSINDQIYDPETIEKIKTIEGEDHYIRGMVKILGDINDDLRLPRTPAPTGTIIQKASPEILENIFKIPKKGLRIGKLITQEEVPVEININKMVSRHLAVLAMTGAGKSNTISVITDGLLKVRGTILIFDMHSEYTNTTFAHGKVNVIKPKINPLYLSFTEIKKLANIPSNAYIQERYFFQAYKEARSELATHTYGKDFINIIKNYLDTALRQAENKEVERPPQSDRKPIADVLNKIEHMKEKYNLILDLGARNIIDSLKQGHANILDLGSVDEFASDVVVSHILRNILQSRKDYIRSKEGLGYPVFLVLEEAHILAPQKRDTEAKHWITRIAREGRKFSVGLCLVSQSPKSLDSEALSQANNMIILRLVEPTDQNHVQRASENLSDDLVAQLPSLNIGEAIVLGLMTRIPTLVRIDEFMGKTIGGDLDIVDEWDKSYQDEKARIENEKQEYRDLGGAY